MPIRQNDNINVADRPVQQLSEMVLSGSDERDAIKYLDPILADMGYDEAERNEYYRQEREIIEHERNRPGVLTHALHGVQNSALGRTFRGQEATALPQDYRKDVPAFQQFVMGIAQFIPDAPLFALGGGAGGFVATEMMQKAADKRNTARWKRAREMRPDLHDSELERWMQSPQGMGALSGWEIAQSVRDEPDDLPDTLEGVKQLAGEILPIAAAGAKGVALDRVLKVAGGGAYKLGAKTMTAGERVAVETAEKAGAEAAARGASQNTRLYHAGQVEEAQRALSAKLSTISPALGAFKTAAEVVALPTASAAMEGRFPTGEEIIHNGMLVLGLNGMHMLPHVTRSMRQIFPRTGITPEELRRQIGENPNLLAEMMAGQINSILSKLDIPLDLG
ncbi:MAG: hypothetical protein IK027_06725, partial [Deltaproteobacteria bacterium]|nr:hypothetical protein [Deltaproteobacteria bacterium]